MAPLINRFNTSPLQTSRQENLPVCSEHLSSSLPSILSNFMTELSGDTSTVTDSGHISTAEEAEDDEVCIIFKL